MSRVYPSNFREGSSIFGLLMVVQNPEKSRRRAFISKTLYQSLVQVEVPIEIILPWPIKDNIQTRYYLIKKLPFSLSLN